MSNIKEVGISARVPFNWLDIADPLGLGDGALDAGDVAFVGRLLLSPSMGLEYAYVSDGYEPNSHGGQTAMYRLAIEGQEALRTGTIDHLIDVIKKSGGTVSDVSIVDIENNQRIR